MSGVATESGTSGTGTFAERPAAVPEASAGGRDAARKDAGFIAPEKKN